MVSQLARADAFLVIGSTLVPASIKINPRHVDSAGWLHVPLWITRNVPRPPRFAQVFSPEGVHIPPHAAVKTAVAGLDVNGRFLRDFADATAAVSQVMARLDGTSMHRRALESGHRHFSDPAANRKVARVLQAHADAPLTELVEALRSAVPGDYQDGALGCLTSAVTSDTVSVVNNPVVTGAWAEIPPVALLQHQHLWRSTRAVAA
jgi:hypothetical protein